MPNKSQEQTESNSVMPNRKELWSRIVKVLGTDSPNIIAAKLKIKAPSVSDWKKGDTLPKIAHLIEIANLGNTSLDYLLTGEFFWRQLPSADGKEIYGVSNHQIFLTRLNNDLVNLLKDIARTEVDNLYPTLKIPYDEKETSVLNCLIELFVLKSLEYYGFLENKKIDLGWDQEILNRFSFLSAFSIETQNLEKKIRKIVQEELNRKEKYTASSAQSSSVIIETSDSLHFGNKGGKVKRENLDREIEKMKDDPTDE